MLKRVGLLDKSLSFFCNKHMILLFEIVNSERGTGVLLVFLKGSFYFDIDGEIEGVSFGWFE